MNYYCNQCVALVTGLSGNPLKGASIDSGLAGGAPGESAPFRAIANLYFNTMPEFEQSFGPNADKIMSDLSNFTTIQPVVQISEVML